MKLGRVQGAVLGSMKRFGKWPAGWIYGNRSTTVRALEGLEKRGLVRRTGGNDHWPNYEITEKGVVA